jgi:hypothetical protein
VQWPTTEATFTFGNGHEKAELRRFTPRKDGHQILLGEVVYCVGDSSDFRLSRRAGSNTYVVDRKASLPSDRSTYNSAFGDLAHASHAVLSVPLSRIMTLPNFKLLSATTRDEGGRALMEVRLEYGNASPVKTQVALLLEPVAGWRVLEWEHYAPAIHETFKARIEYEPEPSRSFLPRLVHFETGEQGRSDHAEFSDWSFVPTSDEEFRMTHYGIPDLTKPTSAPYWRYAWLILLVAGFLIMAVVLRQLSQRTSPAQPS